MERSGGSDRRAGPEGMATILVVEDDVYVRQTIEWALEDEGLAVETAANGQQALEWVSRRKPGLVILDMGLPIVDGFGVADGRRPVYGDGMPILTVSAEGRAAEKARRVGAVDYLHKPFEIDALIGAVRRALGG